MTTKFATKEFYPWHQCGQSMENILHYNFGWFCSNPKATYHVRWIVLLLFSEVNDSKAVAVYFNLNHLLCQRRFLIISLLFIHFCPREHIPFPYFFLAFPSQSFHDIIFCITYWNIFLSFFFIHFEISRKSYKTV